MRFHSLQFCTMDADTMEQVSKYATQTKQNSVKYTYILYVCIVYIYIYKNGNFDSKRFISFERLINDIIVWLNFSLTYLRFTINVCSCICIYICMYIHINVSSFEFSIRNVQLYRKYHNPSFISSVQPSNLETVLFDNRWSIDILLSPLSGKIRNLEVVKLHLISPKELFLSSHHWPLRPHLVILYISCYKDIVAEVGDTFHRNRQTWRVLLYYWRIHL